MHPSGIPLNELFPARPRWERILWYLNSAIDYVTLFSIVYDVIICNILECSGEAMCMDVYIYIIYAILCVYCQCR